MTRIFPALMLTLVLSMMACGDDAEIPLDLPTAADLPSRDMTLGDMNSADGTVPSDGFTPNDGAVDQDGTLPDDGFVNRDGAMPDDGSVNRDGAMPDDGATATDGLFSPDGFLDRDGFAPADIGISDADMAMCLPLTRTCNRRLDRCCGGSHCITTERDGGPADTSCRECAPLDADCSDSDRYGIFLNNRCCGTNVCRNTGGDGGVPTYRCVSRGPELPDAG